MPRRSPGTSRCTCLGMNQVPSWLRAKPMRAVLGRFKFGGRGLVVVLPYVWLMLFFVVPFLIVLKISFSDIDLAIPPYKPLWIWDGEHAPAITLNFNNYAFLFTDKLYVKALLNSLKVAFVSSMMCLLIGYPMAYGIARSRPAVRNVLLMLIILPFWTSLLRSEERRVGKKC